MSDIKSQSAVFIMRIDRKRNSKWRLNPSRCRRCADDSLWAPAGDTPFPIQGWNLVRLRKAAIGWWLDYSDRWITYDPKTFTVEYLAK